LVPASDVQALQPRLASQRVTAYLESRGIVGGLFDADLGWLAAGEQAWALFARGQERPTFEYLIVYEHGVAQFVPNAHMGRFGVVCDVCGVALDDTLQEFLHRQHCLSQQWDPKVSCPSCRSQHRLRHLRCKVDTAVTCFYLNFCNVGGTDLAADVVADLEQCVGTKLRVIIERL
jgi:hypothetical protein